MPKRKSKSLDPDKPKGKESKVELDPKTKYKKSPDSGSRSKSKKKYSQELNSKSKSEISSKTMSSSKTSTKNLTLAKVNNLGIKIPKIPKSTYNSSSLFAAGMGHRSEETYHAKSKRSKNKLRIFKRKLIPLMIPQDSLQVKKRIRIHLVSIQFLSQIRKQIQSLCSIRLFHLQLGHKKELQKFLPLNQDLYQMILIS